MSTVEGTGHGDYRRQVMVAHQAMIEMARHGLYSQIGALLALYDRGTFRSMARRVAWSIAAMNETSVSGTRQHCFECILAGIGEREDDPHFFAQCFQACLASIERNGKLLPALGAPTYRIFRYDPHHPDDLALTSGPHDMMVGGPDGEGVPIGSEERTCPVLASPNDMIGLPPYHPENPNLAYDSTR